MSQELSTPFLCFVHTFARSVGFLAVFPLGETFGGITRKLLLAVCSSLAFSVSSLCSSISQTQPASVEVLAVDLILGMLFSLPFLLFASGAGLVGEVIDSCRGQTAAQVQFPMLEGSFSLLGNCLQQWCLALCLISGLFFEAMTRLYLHKGLSASNFTDVGRLTLGNIVGLCGYSLSVAVPCCVLCLLVECGLALTSKLALPIQGNTEGYSIKTVLVVLGAGYWLDGVCEPVRGWWLAMTSW